MGVFDPSTSVSNVASVTSIGMPSYVLAVVKVILMSVSLPAASSTFPAITYVVSGSSSLPLTSSRTALLPSTLPSQPTSSSSSVCSAMVPLTASLNSTSINALLLIPSASTSVSPSLIVPPVIEGASGIRFGDCVSKL